MLFGVSAQSRDTPTNEALRLRPWLGFALCLQMIVGALLLYIGDLWGFMLSMVVVGFGYQVLKADLDVHWVMCYGTVVLTQAIFDITHLMVRIHHIPDPFFEKYFWLDVCLVTAPFVSAFQTWIMLRAYASFMEEEERHLWSGYNSFVEPPPNQYGSVERAPGEPYDWTAVGRGRVMESPKGPVRDVPRDNSPVPVATIIAEAMAKAPRPMSGGAV